jgi:hypothetical protein
MHSAIFVDKMIHQLGDTSGNPSRGGPSSAKTSGLPGIEEIP